LIYIKKAFAIIYIWAQPDVITFRPEIELDAGHRADCGIDASPFVRAVILRKARGLP
jgi:hypothetical protein